MKQLLILSAFLSIIGSSAFANDLLSVTSAPTYSVQAAGQCFFGSGDAQGYACLTSTTLAPISSSTLAALIALKEEIVQVEQDAHNALAGEGVSIALSELINHVRSENSELSELSDNQIISLLLEVNNQ